MAQENSERHEFWPEIEIFIPLQKDFRLLLFANSQKASETGDALEAEFGGAVDYFWRKRLTFRTGYSHTSSKDSAKPFSENRIFLEQTFHKPLARQFALSDRNREEFRWVSGDASMRFRNRLKLEKNIGIKGRSLVPYASGEIYYDTKYSTFNRYRVTTGAQFVFQKRDIRVLNVRRQHVIDFYYLWQEDTRSETKHLRAIGITFEIHF